MKRLLLILSTLLLLPSLGAQSSGTIRVIDKEAEKVFTDLQEALRNPERVHHLSLRNQNLRKVPTEVLRLVNLRSLDLSENKIRNLKGVSFAPLSHLQYLELADNQLSEIPEAFIDDLNPAELEVFNLSGNGLRSLPESINKLRFLEELLLADNKLLELPPLRLKFLKLIRLDRNGLSTFPETLLQLAKLESINLNGNNIATLPEGLLRLNRLRFLNIGDNQLTDIPDFSSLSRLRTLIIDWNLFDDPDAVLRKVAKVWTLEVLSAEQCGIEEIPAEIHAMRRLREFSLINNKIQWLPAELAKLKRLEKIWLSGNPFSNQELPRFGKNVKVIY